MRKDDKQLGTPFVDYTDTKANIEALPSIRLGAHAVATDHPTAPFGVYTGAGWHWYSTGSVGGTTNHNSLTGLQGGTGSQYYHLGYNEWGGLVTGSLTYLHKHSAVDIVTGTMNPARLGTGTANSGTYLRGDQSWGLLVDGTYTPGLSGTSNVTSVALNQDFIYSRIGGVVWVCGSVQVDPAAIGNTQVRITLPVPSNFSTSYDLNGNATTPVNGQSAGSVIADETNDAAILFFNSSDGANRFWRLVFMYRVIP